MRTYEIDGRRVIFDVDEALDRLEADDVLGFDIETGGLDFTRDPIATVQLFGEKTDTLALLHVRGHLPVRLKRFFESPHRLFIGHNLAMFDVPFLARAGVDVYQARWYDSLIAETVITPGARGDVRHSLKATLKRRLGVDLKKDIDHHSWMNEELTDEQVYYAVRDVVYLPKLREAQLAQAKKLGSVTALEMEMDMLPAVIRMKERGMPISKPALLNYLDQQRLSLSLNTEIAARILGVKGLNPSSNKQVREALAGIGIKAKSTRDDVLASIIRDLAHYGDVGRRYAQGIQAIRDARAAKTRIGYYSGDFWDKYVEPDRDYPHLGWVHANFRPCGANTGRFTSSEPNIQQVPVDMRHVFRAPPGYKVITCDYSAIEVRVAAALANDEVMKEALKSEDIHTTVASLVFDVPYDEVTKDQRKMAKAMNFLLLFGGGVKGLHSDILSSAVDISEDAVKDIFSKYFGRFRGAWRMREKAQTIAHTQSQYWLEMPNGLKRLLTGNTLKPTIILNNLVQGTAGVGLKYALIDMVQSGLYKYLGITVHDEIVIIVPEEKAEWAAEELKAAMLRGMARVIDTHVKVGLVVADHWAKN